MNLESTGKKSHVLLIHPYIPSRFNGAPIGLLYLAAIARADGHEVRVIDLQADPDRSELSELLQVWRPHVVGITSTSPSHSIATALAVEIKERHPNVIIIKGGVHETYCAYHTLANNPAIDFAMAGKADASFLQFLNLNSYDRRYLERIPGLAFRVNGCISVTSQSTSRIDLDHLPYPACDLLRNVSYYDFKIFGGKKTAQVQTMRGCPFQCVFCNQRNRKPNVRSIGSVVAELHFLKARGYCSVFFDDATFTVDKQRTIALCRAILHENLQMTYACQTRSELIDSDVASAMAAAGFVYISFGLETADEDTLQSLLKTVSPRKHVQRAKDAVQLCNRYGIASCINLIAGLPNETNSKLVKTFQYAHDLNSTYVSLSALALYPHEDPETARQYENGVSQEDIWCHYDEGFGAIHPYLTPERAREIFCLAQDILGDKLAVV